MKISVIPDDKTIIINGKPLIFDFVAPANLHALQWFGSHGKIEQKQGEGLHFEDLSQVQPFIDAYNAEADRLAEIAARPPTAEQIAAAAIEAAKAELIAIDAASIRAIREYIASKPDATQILKDRETAAQAARAKLK